MRVSLPENIVGRRAVLHFRRCHALAGAAVLVRVSLCPLSAIGYTAKITKKTHDHHH